MIAGFNIVSICHDPIMAWHAVTLESGSIRSRYIYYIISDVEQVYMYYNLGWFSSWSDIYKY